jgi:hypothetical protein
MSGGSYNYLCAAVDLEDLLTRRNSLKAMADRLAELGYADDAAKETEELVVLLNQWAIRTEVRMRRLADLWQAVEWWDSSDSSEDGVREALAKYRSEHDDAGQPRA